MWKTLISSIPKFHFLYAFSKFIAYLQIPLFMFEKLLPIFWRSLKIKFNSIFEIKSKHKTGHKFCYRNDTHKTRVVLYNQ